MPIPRMKSAPAIPLMGSQNNSVKYLGVDPGVSGGLALITLDETLCYPMPGTLPDLWRLINGLPANTKAVVEKVGGYHKTNPKAALGSAMFKFGQWYGAVLLALHAAGIPFQVVDPTTWQKSVGVGRRKKEESTSTWKNRLKGKAQELNPNLKVTLKTADALLIAHYARNAWVGVYP